MTRDELAALDAAATKGPWNATERSGYREITAPCNWSDWYGEPRSHAVLYCDTEIEESEQDANGALITYLRNHVPDILALLDENERLREAIEGVWRGGFQAARDCLPDEEAFVLTADVEHDLWLDSSARAALNPPQP